MTYAEIMDEIQEDMNFVLDVSDRKDAKVRRIIQKSTKFPVRVHSFITTQRKNRWVMMWEALNKKGGVEDSLFSMACILNTIKGKFVVMPTLVDGRFVPLIFLPHFFSRFAQRIGLDMHGEELILRYLQYNYNFSFGTKRRMVNEGSWEVMATATSREGIALGFKVAHAEGFLLKTFITYDMSKDDQIDDFLKSEELREKHYNEQINSIFNEIRKNQEQGHR